MVWNKGLTKETDERVRAQSIAMTGRVFTMEHKAKLSKTRKRLYAEGKVITPFKNNPQLAKIVADKNKGKHYNQNNWCKGHTKYTHPSLMAISKKIKGSKNPLLSKIMKEKYKDKTQHPCWKGGISFIKYGEEFNKSIKLLLRKTYNFVCQQCGVNEKELNKVLDIHHIDYNKQNNILGNLIPLCRKCNINANFDRGRWFMIFSNKKLLEHLTMFGGL